MGRKARERLMRGQRRAKPDQVVYGYQDPHSRDKAGMMAMLAAAGDEERDGIRQYLRDDGSARALALLSELEKKWAVGQTTTRTPAR